MRTTFAVFFALALVLTSIGGVVAQTRMAAAGSFCGFDQPAILIDASGLPVLDGNGQTIAAVDCVICHLTNDDDVLGATSFDSVDQELRAIGAQSAAHIWTAARVVSGQARAPPRMGV